MTVFALKKYQTATLAVLQAYLERARIVGAKPAFDDMDKAGVREPRAYRPPEGLETVPYVCLRLPTGVCVRMVLVGTSQSTMGNSRSR